MNKNVWIIGHFLKDRDFIGNIGTLEGLETVSSYILLNFPYHTSCIKFYLLIVLFPQESVKHGGFVKDTLENQENLTPQGICFSSLTLFNICLSPSLFFMITVDNAKLMN